MSAFIVSHAHINALVSAMLDARMSYWTGQDRVYVTRANAEEVGRILLAENVRSVTHRYGGRLDDDEQNAAALYRFAYAGRPRSPVQLIKAVHCLDYQSCETEDWESSIAWRICQAILANATTKLPGYETAAWEITDWWQSNISYWMANAIFGAKF
jgi:hypothetical protein